MPSFLALFGGNKLHVAVLVDYAHGAKGKVEELRTSELLREGHVFTPTMYVDDEGEAEADTEDLLGRDTYCGLVKACYS